MALIEKQVVSPAITQVYIELSSHCNLSCRTCLRNSIDDLRPVHFSHQMMDRLLPMLKDIPFLERIVLFGFGEALCNPEFEALTTKLATLGKRLVLITNAAFISEAVSVFLINLPVHELYVSWDDDVNGTLAEIRRGSDLHLFKNNIERLITLKARLKSPFPETGIEMVIQKKNYKYLPDIMKYGDSIGIDRYIVSNLFPYSEEMTNEIVYALSKRPADELTRLLNKAGTNDNIKIAEQIADRNRKCPFVEKGTAFINSHGDLSSCPELAYSHCAYYFGKKRHHNKRHFGNIKNQSLSEIWGSVAFKNFRNNFLYYEFPDCATCYKPEICYHRTKIGEDCFSNATPCGECLWARDIVLCP